jgi:hypothetical protein
LLSRVIELRVKYLDLDPGSFKLCCKKYIDKISYNARQNLRNNSKNFFIMQNIMIFLLNLVPYPKPIKLGPIGSSTKRWGSVKKLFRQSIIYRLKNFQKIKNFEKSKTNAKSSARAPEGAGNCQKIFSIIIAKEKLKIYQKNFVPNFKMPIAKSAIRSTIGRLKQKLGPRNHISTFYKGNLKKSRENDCTNSCSSSSSRSRTRNFKLKQNITRH